MIAAIRPAAVAGRFYPGSPAALRAAVRGYLEAAAPAPEGDAPPAALIVPHAGYPYSGPVAASGYRHLEGLAGRVRRVVLLGTAHSRVRGVATTHVAGFATPMGVVHVDGEAVRSIEDLPGFGPDEGAHAGDHALEVQLPFLLAVLGEGFALVPLLVGPAEGETVAAAIERLWNPPDSLVVVSSDLSHDLPHAAATASDRATADAIEALDPSRLGPNSACGRHAIAGLLLAARRRGLQARTVDLRTSADVVPGAGRVVGYGSFVVA
jgi:AmmeMemoRadiSam system protein B